MTDLLKYIELKGKQAQIKLGLNMAGLLAGIEKVRGGKLLLENGLVCACAVLYFPE